MYDICYIAPITISTGKRVVIRAFQTMRIGVKWDGRTVPSGGCCLGLGEEILLQL